MKIDLKPGSLYDICGIGSLLVDLTASVNYDFLKRFSLSRGTMTFVDDEISAGILDALSDLSIEATAGGSSANTLAGAAMLGCRAALMGKIGRDKYGNLYAEETGSAGVSAMFAEDDGLTGHAITLITPDLERTFAVNLGAALNFDKSNVNTEAVEGSSIIHIEGFLLEKDNLLAACEKAFDSARDNNTAVSIDLSDPALIERIKPVFDRIIDEYVSIIFANETEAEVYTGLKPAKAVLALAERCKIAVVKTGAEGSLISDGNSVIQIKPFKTELVNTNGAGDAYAAGFLSGLAKGFSVERAGNLGSYIASLAVSMSGARIREKIDIESAGAKNPDSI